MGRIKIIFGLLIAGLFIVGPVYAATVSIQKLPTRINTDTFKLSCTVLGGGTAQFSYSKNGGSFTDFGSPINLSTDSCLVQVTNTQVNDHTDYVFKVTVDGGPDSDTTSTIYDVNGPAPVSGYYKEHISDGFNKLHWRNPPDADFTQVVIYRGDTPDFSADPSHEVARVGGSPNSDMTHDDHYSPDGNKTHYYNIRALDQAGNSSSLVGDGSTTTIVTSTTPTLSATGGTVQTLPKEEDQKAEGSVLSEESTLEPTIEPSEDETSSVGKTLFSSNTLKIGVLVVLAGLVLYFVFGKKK
ncbi:hypothetical protein A2985_01105 [Candidatus Woesebacteria bacterium RIFCSPLOWO2_01_FULL_43_11]|nr:MAG: hypothetical protein A3F62_04365 [Candidatus Woesebacteria bacterium RIFCSPHIGHO2_12_FULL_44_11]OGM68603.1 MAG: hypothetical protein A2985_01105 [Candidatus Woesebacteria bacterium RIFCSPLOWO2_01_FULL_43_11]